MNNLFYLVIYDQINSSNILYNLVVIINDNFNLDNILYYFSPLDFCKYD